MTIRRMDDVLIVVEDLEAAKAFFVELGMDCGRPTGHSRVELSQFRTPPAVQTGPENAPSNALGIRRIMFAVDDVDEVVARLRRSHGAELVGEIAQYQDIYRLCFLRGPEELSAKPGPTAENLSPLRRAR